MYIFPTTNKVFFVFILLFLYSCINNSNSSKRILKIDPDASNSFKYSELFSKFKYIPLRSGSVGEIGKLIMQKDGFYLSANRGAKNDCILKYNNLGELVESFCKQGEGPNEYASNRDFNFSFDGKNIEILDRIALTIMTYSKSGELIYKTKHSMFGNSFFPVSDNEYLIFCGSNITEFSNGMLVLYNKNEKKVKKNYFPIDPNPNKQYLNLFDRNNFLVYQDSLFFMYGFNDNIYYYDPNDKNIHQRLHVDFNGKNIPEAFMNKEYVNIMDFYEKVRKTNYAFRIMGYQETKGFISFCFEYKNKFLLFIYNKKTGVQKVIDKLTDDLQIKGMELKQLVDYGPYCINENDEIIFVIPGELMMENRPKLSSNSETTALFSKIEESKLNPVLLVAKLK